MTLQLELTSSQGSVMQNLDPQKISSARNKFSCKIGTPLGKFGPLTHAQKARSKLILSWYAYGRCWLLGAKCHSFIQSRNGQQERWWQQSFGRRQERRLHLGLRHPLCLKKTYPCELVKDKKRAVRKHAATRFRFTTACTGDLHTLVLSLL